MSTTIVDVAKRAQVSTATVSRVLSNPEKVQKATRARVLEVIHAMGYAPNASAKSLRTLTTRKLLVTVPQIANPFFSLIIQGIEESARREGYSVMLGDTNHDPQLEEMYGTMILRREVDGMIFLGHSVGKSLQARIQSGASVPIVNGCEHNRRLRVSSAHIDNVTAAYEAMEHLYGLGHTRIGVITGPRASPLTRDRLFGAQRCAREHGTESMLSVVHGDFSIESGVAAAERLLGQPSSPTAVFCFSDEIAIGAMDYAHRIGLSIPDGLSVIGFDDIRLARYLRPALTTVSQPMLEIGRETVRLLLGVLRGEINSARAVTLRHELQIRETTGAPRRASQQTPAARDRGEEFQ